MTEHPKGRQPAERYPLQPGAVALPPGLLWLEGARALVAADAHLAYEEAIGGALPLWSTAGALAVLLAAIDATGAGEVILLGDIVHSSRVSDGAAAAIGAALQMLREHCAVTLVAGNHEGRTRGKLLLGETHERLERDGWTLVHGDDPLAAGARTIVGHLHPALPLARGESTPVFLACPSLLVLPALTPYSTGLDVLSADATTALHAFVRSTAEIEVVATTADRVYPFGRLGSLRTALRRTPANDRRRPGSHRKRLM